MREESFDRVSTIEPSRVAVIIPTCNARMEWRPLADGIRLQGLPPNQVLVVDSNSSDGTRELAKGEGYKVICIERCDFNHGGTRQLAANSVPWADFVIYLTQDAVLADANAFNNLLAAFEDSTVAAAYGRQLPRPNAKPIAAHARIFNYPPESMVRDLESRHTLGLKATFMSNSFSAYRKQALAEVGGFPSDVIMAEDAFVGAKLLIAGWKTAYRADSVVYHSHDLTIAQEFRRYFDTGVYHHRQAELISQFGAVAGEGKRFVLSELAFLFPDNIRLIPIAVVRTIAKALGYYLGRHEAKLGPGLARRLSLHKSYWTQTHT